LGLLAKTLLQGEEINTMLTLMQTVLFIVSGCLVIVGIILFFIFQRTGWIQAEQARELIRHGARVIDVRSEWEFARRHIPGVINIPGGKLREKIEHEVPDKSAVVLLHCLTGGQSGLSTRVLRRMGYKRVFNLGGIERATHILKDISPKNTDRQS
jgi:rhodanese-related sulfurtransferase